VIVLMFTADGREISRLVVHITHSIIILFISDIT
jgi:hypothetical protein